MLSELSSRARSTRGQENEAWALFTWEKHDSPKQTTCSSASVKIRKNARASRFFEISNNQIKCDGVMHIPSWCLAIKLVFVVNVVAVVVVN